MHTRTGRARAALIWTQLVERKVDLGTGLSRIAVCIGQTLPGYRLFKVRRANRNKRKAKNITTDAPSSGWNPAGTLGRSLQGPLTCCGKSNGCLESRSVVQHYEYATAEHLLRDGQ